MVSTTVIGMARSIGRSVGQLAFQGTVRFLLTGLRLAGPASTGTIDGLCALVRLSQAAAASAASTTLDSNIALVIGPTPPGLGAQNPATSATSGATSPTMRPLTRLTPTSSTAAPGLTMSAVISHGHPGRGDHDVGLPDHRRQVPGAGVAQRDGGVLAAPGQQQAHRPADGEAAPDHDRVRAVDRDLVPAEQFDDAQRGAGQRRRLAQHQRAQVLRVQSAIRWLK